MFLFWNKKTKKDKNIYPSFTARIFATLVDTALAALILVPLFYLISFALYKDTPPLKRLYVIMERTAKNSKTPKEAEQNLQQDPDYQNFIKEHGESKILIEQALQLLLFSGATLAFWLKTHSTPGKMLLSMKIVDDKTMGKPSVLQLLVRMACYPISILPLCIGIFYIAFNKKHRAWHDIISGTLVVYTK